MTAPLVTVENLKTYFPTEEGLVKAVDDVSFTIGKRHTLGVVGESGCGKSVTAMSILRLLSPPGYIAGGQIVLHADNAAPVTLSQLSEDQMRKFRGGVISMIFQEPMTSLNPVFTVGDQIGEALQLHRGATKAEARRRAIEMLAKVRIPEPARARRRLSASIFGRHAAASNDRDGPGLQPAIADRRRADYGARCDDPGAGAGPVATIAR